MRNERAGQTLLTNSALKFFFENLSQLKSVKIADKISGSEWS